MKGLEQVEIMRQFDEIAVFYHFAAKSDDEGAAAKRMNIRRGRAEPLHKGRRFHRCHSLCSDDV